MKNILFITAALLLLSWVMGVFIFHAPSFIHIVGIVGMIVGMQAIIITPKTQADKL